MRGKRCKFDSIGVGGTGAPRLWLFQGTDARGVRGGTLRIRLDRHGLHRRAVSVAFSSHGCVGRAIPKMLYYYQGFDGSVFDWLEYWHDNTGNQMVEYSTKVDCLHCEQDKCKLAGRPYGQLAPGVSRSEFIAGHKSWLVCLDNRVDQAAAHKIPCAARLPPSSVPE